VVEVIEKEPNRNFVVEKVCCLHSLCPFFSFQRVIIVVFFIAGTWDSSEGYTKW